LLKTLRVVNASSSSEEFAALARFGSFFFGQLWDSYGKYLGGSG
jgi:hypothetical protein